MRLLITLAIVLHPAIDMRAARVVMCPVNDAATVVPLILAIKGHRIPFAESLNPRREIDIVSDKQRFAGCKSQR